MRAKHRSGPGVPAQVFRRWIAAESGAAALEYALIAGLVALAVVGSVEELGGSLGQTFAQTSQSLTSSGGGASPNDNAGGTGSGASAPMAPATSSGGAAPSTSSGSGG